MKTRLVSPCYPRVPGLVREPSNGALDVALRIEIQ